MSATKNFSSKGVNETAEKIFASLKDKSLEEAYQQLVIYFAEARTKVIKQAVLKVRLKVLLARITALKNGVFDQKDMPIEELVADPNQESAVQAARVTEQDSADKQNEAQEPSPIEDPEGSLVTVSISQDVEVLGTTFSAGTIVGVPAQQLAELIETGKAEIVADQDKSDNSQKIAPGEGEEGNSNELGAKSSIASDIKEGT